MGRTATGGADDREWKGVSRKSPCPKCEGTSWCQVTTDGTECMCRRNGDGAYKTATASDQAIYHLHRLKGGPDCNGAQQGASRKKQRKQSGPPPELADVDTRHAVYSAMLEGPCRLADRDRPGLKRRGFPDGEPERLLYGSLLNRSHEGVAAHMAATFGEETLRSVPGFFRNDQGKLSMACLPGLLIPVRDSSGRIVAMKSRPEKTQGPKYLFVSSKNKDGPGPGAPVHIPLGSPAQSATWRLTEGEIKADLSWLLSGLPTISVSGAGNWRGAVAALESLGCRVVRLAFDADAWSTREVAEAMVACYASLAAKGVEVEMERWPADFDGKPIKGIDDALTAGIPIEVLKRDDVRSAIEEAARLVPGGTDTAGDATEQRIAGIRGRIRAMVEGNDVASLLRDETLLKDLAWLKRHHAGEFGAIKADLKQIRGFSARDFDRAVKEQEPTRRRGDGNASAGRLEYIDSGDALAVKIMDDEGRFTVEHLSRFGARITEAVVYDDGAETRRVLRIEATIQGAPPIRRTAEVPADQYDEMKWVSGQLGPAAVIWPGRGTKDYLRHGIQELSLPIAERTVYQHTGWRQIGGAWKYLHTGGAIGADGLDRTASVDLGDALKGFRLPAPPEGDALRRAVRAAFGLLRFGQEDRCSSRALAAILVSLPYRAAIGPSNYSVQFKGPTGTHKSSAAALVQQHFGPTMGLNDLPIGWEGTANAIEGVLHQLKDALVVVDDFVPAGSTAEVAHAHREAERIIRSQGNRQGRLRMNPDGTIQVPKRPRGTVLSTGEDKLRRRSANARTLPVSFVREDPTVDTLGTVDLEVLTACQEAADKGLYAEALAGFVRWLAPRYEEVRSALPERARELRVLATRPGDHARTPDIVADLAASFDVFLSFAAEVGAIDRTNEQRAREMVWDGLMEAAAEARADQQDEGDPATRYIQLLVAALNSTKAYLSDYKTGDVPEGVESACGWHQEMKYAGDGQLAPIWVPGPNTPRIGWINSEYIFLEPDAAYNAALRMLHEQGNTLPSKTELHLHLFHNKKLARTDTRNKTEGRGRLTSREWIEKSRRNVLVLRASDFWSTDDEEAPEAAEVEVGAMF